MSVSVSTEILNLPGQLRQNIYNIHEVNSMVISNTDQNGQKQSSNGQGRNARETQQTKSGIQSSMSKSTQQKSSKTNKQQAQHEEDIRVDKPLTENNIEDIYKRVEQNLINMAQQKNLDIEMQEQALNQLKETITSQFLNANYNKVNLHFCKEDVYSGSIDIGHFLQLFIYRYDFSMPFNEYIKYFKNLNDVFQQISKITKHIFNESKIFNSKTREGQKRMQQIKTANMFNQQVNESFLQLMKCCSGAEYIPDTYFKVKYEKLPEWIQKLVDTQLLSTDKQKILYQIIACGTNDMKLTYNENYAAIVETLEKHLDRTGVWGPYVLYLQILKANKKAPQTKTVVYKRCGYETYLINQLEKVMLYFIMRIIMARKQYGVLQITPNELITLYQKILSMVAQVTTIEELKDDDLWLEVEDFVNWRTKQPLVETAADLAFKFDRYGIKYETGEVFEQSQEDAEKQVESIRQKRQKQAEEAEAERRRKEEEIERLIRQK